MGANSDLILFALFLAWSAMVAVSAHRRVRNAVLASAGAAGVATGSFLGLIVLTSGQFDPLMAVAFIVGLVVSLAVALVTWVAMKLGGWLPGPDDAEDPGRGSRHA